MLRHACPAKENILLKEGAQVREEERIRVRVRVKFGLGVQLSYGDPSSWLAEPPVSIRVRSSGL